MKNNFEHDIPGGSRLEGALEGVVRGIGRAGVFIASVFGAARDVYTLLERFLIPAETSDIFCTITFWNALDTRSVKLIQYNII